jgi:hypothetical protein
LAAENLRFSEIINKENILSKNKKAEERNDEYCWNQPQRNPQSGSQN